MPPTQPPRPTWATWATWQPSPKTARIVVAVVGAFTLLAVLGMVLGASGTPAPPGALSGSSSIALPSIPTTTAPAPSQVGPGAGTPSGVLGYGVLGYGALGYGALGYGDIRHGVLGYGNGVHRHRDIGDGHGVHRLEFVRWGFGRCQHDGNRGADDKCPRRCRGLHRSRRTQAARSPPVGRGRPIGPELRRRLLRRQPGNAGVGAPERFAMDAGGRGIPSAALRQRVTGGGRNRPVGADAGLRLSVSCSG